VSTALAGGRPSRRPPAAVDGDATAFREAMSELAGGVVLVGCRVDGRPWGVTATAFQSVSVAPPTVLVSLGSETRAAAAIAQTGRFGVDVLADAHVVLARFAASAGAPKYVERFLSDGAIRGALAHLDCVVCDAVEVADPVVFFARVLEARREGDGDPLLYHRRGYRTLRPPEAGCD
jgi:flavin reductase (DIM6/NTAB) family NADH-FMN oxidoreductase RutF